MMIFFIAKRVNFAVLYTVIITLCFLSFSAEEIRAQDFDLMDASQGRFMYEKSPESQGIMGYPYLHEEFINGTLYLRNGEKRENVPLRYVPFIDSLQVQFGRHALIMDSNQISRFEFVDNGQLRTFQNGYENEEFEIEPHHFFEIISDNNGQKILMQHRKQFARSNFDTIHQTGSRYDEFRPRGTIYIVENDEWDTIRLRRRAVLSVLGSHSSQLRAYAQDNNLSFRNVYDVLEIITYHQRISS